MGRVASKSIWAGFLVALLVLPSCYVSRRVPTAHPPLQDSIQALVGCCLVTLHHPRIVADTLLVGWARGEPPVEGHDPAVTSGDSALVTVPMMTVVREKDRRRTAWLTLGLAVGVAAELFLGGGLPIFR